MVVLPLFLQYLGIVLFWSIMILLTIKEILDERKVAKKDLGRPE